MTSKKNHAFIPLCVPSIEGNEWKYLKECLDTNFVSSVGPFVDRFEKLVADYAGVKNAVATVNGTAALHTALLVAGVQPEDEVLVPTLTFIAPVNAVRYAGAWPVFMDADPEYWQMDTNKLTDFLEKECRWRKKELRNKKTGRRVKAVLPVHILGHACDMDPVLKLARKYNLVVIEDATESLGGKYKNRMTGTLGDIACFSFNGNKLVTSGGGGMIVTDNQKWALRAKYLTTQSKDHPVEYIHKAIGYNYRLTNLQAAVGCAQMEKIGKFISVKRAVASNYTRALRDVPGVTPMKEAPWAFSIFWMYTVLIHSSKYGLSSRQLLKRLAEKKIQSRPLWQPLHQALPYRDCQAFHCDYSQKLYREALSLPCSVGLSRSQQETVIRAISV